MTLESAAQPGLCGQEQRGDAQSLVHSRQLIFLTQVGPVANPVDDHGPMAPLASLDLGVPRAGRSPGADRGTVAVEDLGLVPVLSLFQAVVVPSGLTTRVQPHR